MLAFMQADHMFLIYIGFTVVLQQRMPFPTVEHVCVPMLELHFQIGVILVATGLLNRCHGKLSDWKTKQPVH